MATSSAALLQSEQLLSTEGLVVNLAGSFDQVLKVGASQEVTQVDEFAVALILDVNHTPTVLTSANLLAIDDNGLLTSDNGEGNDFLHTRGQLPCPVLSYPIRGVIGGDIAYLNLSVDRALLIVKLVIIVGVHLEVVERELLLDTLLEGLTLLKGQGVRLGDNGDNVDNIG